MSISDKKNDESSNTRRLGGIVFASFVLLAIAMIGLQWFPNASRVVNILSSLVGVVGLFITVVASFPKFIPRLTFPKIPLSTGIFAVLLLISLSFNTYLFVRQDAKLKPTINTVPSATSSTFVRTSTPTMNTSSTPSPGVLNVPLPPYIAGHGTLIMYNPWVNNNPPSQWDTTNETGSGQPGAGNCAFTADGFHISADQSYRECVENLRDLTNCVVEVQMTQLPGSAGGIILRRNKVSNGGYLVDFDQNGHYTITVDKDANTSVTLRDNSSGLIQKNHAPYLVDLEILGNQITLYVDKVKIESVTDNTFSHGHIGLYVTKYGNGTPQKTEVIFTNLRVWSL